jgi:integrase/recombinase XerD
MEGEQMGIPANKGEEYPADILTRDEADRLIGAVEGRSSIALRNRALLATMYRGALRVSEVVNLRPADVDLDTGTLRVRRGKGGRSRVVGLDTGAVKLLGEWIERRRTLNLDDRKAYLFCSVRAQGGGTKMATSYLRRMLPKLSADAGISKRVHAHIFRHSRACELSGEGVPVNEIQKILGHSSLATTSVYLDHISNDKVIASMRASKWKAPAIR